MRELTETTGLYNAVHRYTAVGRTSDGNLDNEASSTPSARIVLLPYEYKRLALIRLFIVPLLAGFLFGYDIGATSYVLSNWKQHASSSSSAAAQIVAHSHLWQGLMVSMGSLGAWLGSFIIYVLSDRHLGRKQELQLGALLYAVGSAGQGLVPSNLPPIWAMIFFLLGRLMYGVAIGISMHAAPTYLAEGCPSHLRGMLISLKEAGIVLGILLGSVVGLAVLHTQQGGWRIAYAVSGSLAFPMLALSFCIPESCRWLLLQGRDEEALESLKFLYTEEAALQEFRLINEGIATDRAETTVENEDDLHLTTTSPEVTAPQLDVPYGSLWQQASYRRPLIAGVGLVVFQQITGQPTVLSYAAPIFQSLGMSDKSSVLVAAFKLVATVLAALIVEKAGRKKLLYTGCSLMLVALIVMTFAFGEKRPGQDAAVLVAMFAYIGGYQIGFGPMTWLIISEVFPLNVRTEAVAVSVQTNFLLNFVVQLLVPVLRSVVGFPPLFGGFAILTACSIFFVKERLPETKGLTLEQIYEQFEKLDKLEPPSNDLALIEPFLSLETMGSSP